MSTDQDTLVRQVVAQTRRIEAVERALREHRVPLHVAGDVDGWLEREREQLDGVYARLCAAWLEEQGR